jgi:hypothetical protein
VVPLGHEDSLVVAVVGVASSRPWIVTSQAPSAPARHLHDLGTELDAITEAEVVHRERLVFHISREVLMCRDLDDDDMALSLG